MSRAVTSTLKKLPRAFEELSRIHPLRPIHDDVDLTNAQELADALVTLPRRTRDQEDFLDTLSTLIEKYEDEHESIDTRGLDAIAILAELMQAREMSGSDLGRLLGNRALGSAILRRERELSKAHVVKLAAHFHVSPALFLRPVSSAAKQK